MQTSVNFRIQGICALPQSVGQVTVNQESPAAVVTGQKRPRPPPTAEDTVCTVYCSSW